MPGYVLALDQGTTSSRAIVFDERAEVVGSGQQAFPQRFPQPGWVEHDANEIWDSQLAAAREALEAAGVRASDLAAIGIANQRETALIWDRASGEPIAPAIVWQSRQTAGICEDWRARGLSDLVRSTTGLVIDAYFSASKVRWLLDTVPGADERAHRGELAFGTIDTWLMSRLTGGEAHVTDETNASRTMLYDIDARRWSPELLEAFGIPEALLPSVQPSASEFGVTRAEFLGAAVPIRGVAGDQQAALFGQGCVEPGDSKNTYGTGCFLLTTTGAEASRSGNGLLTTSAASRGEASYALEGSIFVAGAAVQWLRDGLGLVESAEETEALARSVPDTGGVYLVPAFTGLGAPHWDEAARGALVGLTRGSERAHIVRATLEAIAYQSRDLVTCIEADLGRSLEALRVDGGACRNDFLMQFQADILGIPVHRPRNLEVTALGAAGLAGVAGGLWSDPAQFAEVASRDLEVIEPRMSDTQRAERIGGWQQAVDRVRTRGGS